MSTPTAACPQWCIEEKCRGDHESDILGWTPATAGVPNRSRYGLGVWFPGVTLRLVHDTLDHLQPSILLHIGSEALDAEALLHAHEARELHANLGRALGFLDGAEVTR